MGVLVAQGPTHLRLAITAKYALTIFVSMESPDRCRMLEKANALPGLRAGSALL
jgi:hypothetical protein